MLDALEFTEGEGDDEYSVLWPGSQMIVLTDASSKNPHLKQNVTNIANRKAICIHFFLSGSISDGVYRDIANSTDGTFLKSYTDWDLATFISSYADRECGVLLEDTSQKKRGTSMCISFQVSLLAQLFKFSGRTRDTVTLTSPSEKSIKVTVNANQAVALHAEPNPESGKWRACANSGIQEFSVVQTTQIDATIIYLIGSDSEGSALPPIECELKFLLKVILRKL